MRLSEEYISLFTADTSDYISVSVDLTFNPFTNSSSECFTVSTVEDTSVEGNETFSLSITSSDPTATVVDGDTTITILDNDGTHYHSHIHNFCTLAQHTEQFTVLISTSFFKFLQS